MNLNEYNEMVLKVKKYPTQYAVIYPILKINGECGELFEKFLTPNSSNDELNKEMGDVVWYIFAIFQDLGLDYNVLNIKNDTLYNKSEVFYNFIDICILTSKLSEKTGKLLRDDEDFINYNKINDEYKNFVQSILITVFYRISYIAKNYGFDMNTVLQTNSDKLLSRFNRGKINGDGDNR